jgi:hypothetical protein
MTLKIVELILAFVFVWLSIALPAALFWQIFKKKIMFYISFEQLVLGTLCLALGHLGWSLAVSYHTLKWNQFIQQMSPQTAAPSGQNQSPNPGQDQAPVLKYPVSEEVKRFLSEMNAAFQDPQKVTPEQFQKLVELKKSTFPEPNAQTQFGERLQTFHRCQLSLYEEAIQALKTGRANEAVIEKCQKERGELFGRDELLPPEVIVGFQNLIQSAAKKEKLKQPNGQEVEITEAGLKQAQAFEKVKIDFLSKLFAP